MNESTETTEGDESTSITERAKAFCKKHKGTIFAISAVLLVAGVVIKQAMDQRAAEDTQCAEDTKGSEVAENSGVAADWLAAKGLRKPPVQHEVSEHTRTLPDGRVIPIGPYTRGGRNNETGKGDTEEPGEAAA
ncbi:hypothetical protein EF908_35345 [Streptomyces sp. WAC04770]|nr:hypothetical protein [Streptomyces sp. WAC04770]RST16201.1 hypothetical protein EF908_35345 [Streptomyces sp. WAC04770]